MLQSDEENDKAKRVKALEEMVKLGQMEQSTFEALRDEIVGGDIENVHLVKGLDRKLLERVRRGEDVLSSAEGTSTTTADGLNSNEIDTPPASVDIDEELDKIEEKEIQPVAKQEKVKQGQMAPPQVAGRKRNRDEILKQLRESRLAAAQSAKQVASPTLGPRFTKLGQKKESSRIEKDERGREVLITIDEHGKVKRKVRKDAKQDEDPQDRGLLMPDKDAKPLGMEIATAADSEEKEEENSDIFEGVGADYDPLADIDDDEDDSEDEDQSTSDSQQAHVSKVAAVPVQDQLDMPAPPLPSREVTNRRNYFGEVDEKNHLPEDTPSNLTDPTILAALKKASTINPLSSEISSVEGEVEAAKLARRKQMLEAHDRDADDMDLGFGSSRFGDEEDGEGKKVKLSVWGKETGDEGRSGEGKGPRKRGPKKRKGDANSAADVLKVMERRKGEAK